MPGIEDRRAAAEAADMLADNLAFLADDNAIGIRLDLDRPANSTRGDRVFVVVEAHQTGLRHCRRHTMEAVKTTTIGDELAALFFEALPDGPIRNLRMPVSLGIGNALVEKQGIQLLKALHPQPWREEAFPHQANLVLDLTLLPTGCRRAGDRLD